MKGFLVLISVMVISLVMAFTNPTKSCFEKYFAGRFSRESEGLTEAVAANIFVSRSMKNCEYRDYFLMSFASIPADGGSLKFIGIFGTWVAVPF